MGIEITISDNINEAMREIRDHARDRMLEAVQEVRNQTLDTLSGKRSGRIYRVPGTKKYYTASAPGEPPAQRLGELRQSVKGGVESQGDAIVGFVGTEKDYGRVLEFGSSKMSPRPWLRVSFDKSADAVKRIFMRKWF